METIIQVREVRFGGSGWKATETTPDCGRFIGQRGRWPTLADAWPHLVRMHKDGEDVRLSASAEQIAEAKARA